jgi:hypothetical protein
MDATETGEEAWVVRLIFTKPGFNSKPNFSLSK